MWDCVFELEHRGYKIYISAGGVSLLVKGGSFTSKTVIPPVKKPSKKKLDEMAEAIVIEHEQTIQTI